MSLPLWVQSLLTSLMKTHFMNKLEICSVERDICWVYYDRHLSFSVHVTTVGLFTATRLLFTLARKARKFTIIYIHHRVSWPRFPIWRKNSSDSRTFKAEIGIFMFALIFRTLWPKLAAFGKIGEGVLRCWPNELVLTFAGRYLCATFSESRSRNATVRMRTDRHTHRQRQTEFVLCPMLYTIAMRQLKKKHYILQTYTIYVF